MTRLLDQAAHFRGYPAMVRTDNGPEFTSRAFIVWTLEHHIRHILIEPGRPMQSGYIEGSNGKFRDECLNEHWFQNLRQAWTEIATWRSALFDLTAALATYRQPGMPSNCVDRQATQLVTRSLPRSINLQPQAPNQIAGVADGGRSHLHVE